MTEPIRYGQMARLPGGRVAITGTIGEVAAKLAYIDSRVGLLSASDPMPTGVPGQFIVTVRTMPRQAAVRAGMPAAPVRRKMPRRAVGVAVAGGVAVGVGVLAGIVWLINAVVDAVADNSTTVVGALLLLAVVLAALRRVTRGGGGRTFSGTFTGRMD